MDINTEHAFAFLSLFSFKILYFACNFYQEGNNISARWENLVRRMTMYVLINAYRLTPIPGIGEQCIRNEPQQLGEILGFVLQLQSAGSCCGRFKI